MDPPGPSELPHGQHPMFRYLDGKMGESAAYSETGRDDAIAAAAAYAANKPLIFVSRNRRTHFIRELRKYIHLSSTTEATDDVVLEIRIPGGRTHRVAVTDPGPQEPMDVPTFVDSRTPDLGDYPGRRVVIFREDRRSR